MQCKRCGIEIPGGEVFCPRCGEEVQLVPDYNSVEYMIQQKKATEELKQREDQERIKKQFKAEKKAAELKRKRRKRAVWITVILLFLMAVTTVGLIYFIQYSRDHSYDYQYQMAYDAYEQEAYDTAKQYAHRALELHPTSDNAMLLLAETYLHMQETDTGIEYLMRYIELHPDSIEAYARIINAYESEDRLEDIRMLFEECNNDIILAEFVSYIPTEVEVLTEPGAYTEKTYVELSCDRGNIYFTTDGTIPGLDSTIYTEPILLEEGDTKIQAICYSQSGIPGTVVTAEYSVTYAIPDPPFISPASGEYDSGTTITVIVPDGCEAYYAFDSIVTDSDKQYTGPVEIPDGEHIFSVIVVSENGKQSYPSSETYVIG